MTATYESFSSKVSKFFDPYNENSYSLLNEDSTYRAYGTKNSQYINTLAKRRGVESAAYAFNAEEAYWEAVETRRTGWEY